MPSLRRGQLLLWWGTVLPLLLVSGTMETPDFLEVKMEGESQVVFWKDNVTILCKVLGSPNLDIRYMGITWFWRNQTSGIDDKVFEFFGDHQKAFRPGAEVSLGRLKTGDASLQLPGIQLREGGEYRCELVVTPQKAQGTILLQVMAKPAIGSISQQATAPNHKDKNIVCKLSEFYPEAINITWRKWTQKVPWYQEISEGIVTDPTIKNEDGTFNTTSYLKLEPSLEDNGTIYECVAWHISLHTPQRLNFTLIEVTESAKTNLLWKILSVFSIITTLILVVIILNR